MSLYYESASLIQRLDSSQDTSLKSLLFGKVKSSSDPPRKSNPAQLYALITETWKWSSLLTEIIERAGVLTQERKLTPQLALVLVHDLLLARKGIAAPENHVLRQAVDRHQTRLKAEFVKARVRAGCASVEELRKKLDAQGKEAASVVEVTEAGRKTWPHPRWLRINTLRTTRGFLEGDEFRDWKSVDSLEEVLFTDTSLLKTDAIIYHIDKHVPNLLALPPASNLSAILAYKQGKLISQDKASCFPAYLLSSGNSFNGDILDACAAPGNKTSHIAAIVSEQDGLATSTSNLPHIYAVERDKHRANILQQMLRTAGADRVKVYGSQDFLKLNVNQTPWNNISAIILDPSCSGSGIVDRNQVMTFTLPSCATTTEAVKRDQKKNMKRKRQNNSASSDAITISEQDKVVVNEQDIKINEENATKLETRLKSLATLQTKMLTFAFSFPKVSKITYSTCSVHDIENECVVLSALSSEVARSRGWRVMRRDEQIQGMRMWRHRGRKAACQAAFEACSAVDMDVDEIAEACIRCEPFTNEGTQGFFVAGFVRDCKTTDQNNGEAPVSEISEEQWLGFDD